MSVDYSKSCSCHSLSKESNIEEYSELKKLLPEDEHYKYVVCDFQHTSENKFSCRYRVNCSTKEEIKQWMQQTYEKSKITFRVDQTFRECSRYVYKVVMRCQHNTRPQSHKIKSPHPKHTECAASMRITTKQVQNKTKKYKSVDCHLPEFPTVVILHHEHNHNILVASALKYRSPLPELQEKCLHMFEAGHTPSRALAIHREDLQKEYEDEYFLAAADRGICPDIQWVFYQYYSLFKKCYGDANGEDMLRSLHLFINNYNTEMKEKCAEVKLFEDKNFCVVIVTPLMKRVLVTLTQSAEVVFVDSSENVDRFGCRVFILMINSCAGGFPVGILIMTSGKEDCITPAFQIYKQFLGEDAFCGRGPKGPLVFMTDDSSSERLSLSNAFPEATLLLCVFHILQAAWRYLWNAITGVPLACRQELFSLIKSMLYSSDEKTLTNNYKTLISRTTEKYSVVKKYVEDLYERRREWAVCYRKNLILRGQNTNNICEAAIRLLKDKVLLRTKAYSVVQLVDFITKDLENFYARKGIDVANGRPAVYLIKKNKYSKKKM